MKKKTMIIAVVCIIAGALIFGFAYDGILTAVERLEHPQKYSESVNKYYGEYGIPQNIIYAVIKTESKFDPKAESKAGAIGLMQLLPSTFRWLSDDIIKEKLPDDHIYDPDTNIKYGTRYLKLLYDKYYDIEVDNWETVFAAYNAGPKNVDDWLSDSRYSDDGKTLKNIPFAETETYVARVVKARAIYLKLYNE